MGELKVIGIDWACTDGIVKIRIKKHKASSIIVHFFILSRLIEGKILIK